MAISRSTYGTRRLAIVLFALLLAALFLLPSQSQGLLQYSAGRSGRSSVFRSPRSPPRSRDFRNLGRLYRLQGVREENRQLRREIELLKGRIINCVTPSPRHNDMRALLNFKQQVASQHGGGPSDREGCHQLVSWRDSQQRVKATGCVRKWAWSRLPG